MFASAARNCGVRFSRKASSTEYLSRVSSFESQGRSRCPLHLAVVRTASALRSSPCDVAGGILDVAGLAVNAVLRINDELEVGTLADPLVDAGGTIPV